MEQIDKRDVAGLAQVPGAAVCREGAGGWAKEKFAIELSPEEMLVGTAATTAGSDDRPGSQDADEIVALIEERARQAYARREIEYPVDHVLAFAFGGEASSVENPYAADYVRTWARAKYNVDIPVEHMRELGVRAAARRADRPPGAAAGATGKLEAEVDPMLAGDPTPAQVDRAVPAAVRRQAGRARPRRRSWKASPTEASARRTTSIGRDDRRTRPPGAAATCSWSRPAALLRQELTDLEQFVLIQIFDQSWKDHLYAMDMLKSGVGLVGFAERDPRIVYKKEGFRYFEEMMAGIRDKVTDLIFRARVVGRAEARSAYRETAAVHEEAGGYGVSENLAATADVAKGAPGPKPAGGEADDERCPGRRAETAVKVKPIVREEAKVGRNDPCPCGSGKKYKKCCGQHLA